MIEIIPAILPKTFSELEEELMRLRGAGGLVQVDLVGKNILAGQDVMPLWEEFDFECDIMLANPVAEVPVCIALGASRICVHANAGSAHEAIESLQHLRGGSYATDVGVALPAGSTAEALTDFEGLYDYVQVMGIAHEGVQGQPFDERAVSLVRALRTAHPTLVIQVDGGVDGTHIEELVQAGASRLVMGHAILKAADPVQALTSFRAQANV